MVAIDDVTFDELGVRWPFPRSLHGQAIDRLRREGARVIAYDIQFTEQTRPSEDNALIEAVDQTDGVVLATTEVDKGGGTAVFGGDRVLRAIGAKAGSSNFDNDDDGVIRRMPYEVAGLKSFARVAADEFRGRPAPKPSERAPSTSTTPAGPGRWTRCRSRGSSRGARRREPSRTASWWWGPPRRRCRTCTPRRSVRAA